MLHVGQGRHRQALTEFSAAERLGAELVSSLSLAARVTGWVLATQAGWG